MRLLLKCTNVVIGSPVMPGACVSKEKAAATPVPQTAPAPAPVPAAAAAMATKKVYIIYYSMYGHIDKMARVVKKGVDSIEGVEGVLYQVNMLSKHWQGYLHLFCCPEQPHTVLCSAEYALWSCVAQRNLPYPWLQRLRRIRHGYGWFFAANSAPLIRFPVSHAATLLCAGRHSRAIRHS
eukprot:GHUV01022971.1.p1 GENE.GHUV01022971.1~~GHUV01022971.1.p1  ORF type:complete len:180 (+),score=22.36 GHUV01022971.1:70-609(+)